MSNADYTASTIAAAIGDPARARMLYCLMDAHARTATELAAVAGVTASTASAHLSRLCHADLIKMQVQGRHRYFRLGSPQVAQVLEGLSVLAGAKQEFKPNTPHRLRNARTCYDHIAGALGVALHDCLTALRWLSASQNGYNLTSSGMDGLASLGISGDDVQSVRRRFAFPCLDWSERRPHLGGALGAALLARLQQKKWITRDLDSRALSVTRAGERELFVRLGIVAKNGQDLQEGPVAD